MWRRLSRMVRSFVGFFISVGENPELILEQNIRDMNDQVPRMNESIAMVKANQTLLEKEEARYKTQVGDLTAKVKASIQGGRDDLAGSFAMQLEQARGALARNQGQLQTARAAFDKALAVKKAFMIEKERKTQEALNAISATHDEMVHKIEEQTAINEARMELALGNVDQQKIKIEEEAQQMQANELVKQFKVEMGLMAPEALPPGPAQKTIGGTEAQKTT
jgi:phage shock protein A